MGLEFNDYTKEIKVLWEKHGETKDTVYIPASSLNHPTQYIKQLIEEWSEALDDTALSWEYLNEYHLSF